MFMVHSNLLVYFFIAMVLLVVSIISSSYSEVLKTVDTDQKVLFLTFDDGPGPYTSQLLDVLDKENVSATFFLLGSRAKNNSVVSRIVLEDHFVGVHSYSHPLLITNISDEIAESIRVVNNLTNTSVTLFRSPYGVTVPNVLSTAKEMNLTVVKWSCFPRDYSANKDQIVRRVSRCFNPGEIIVLHDWQSPQTIQALPEIIHDAKEQGYSFGILS